MNLPLFIIRTHIAAFLRHLFRYVLFLSPTLLFGAGDRPNMVVILSDDHTYSISTVYGTPQVDTPNMMRLAKAGMTFDRAYVASPSCAPSRASLLTGLMPARNGAESNHQAPHAYIRKLPSYLQELGYEVVAFGKVGHYKQTSLYGFDYFAHTGFHEDVAVQAAVDWLEARKDKRPLALFVGTNWPHTPWPEEGSKWNPADVEIPHNHVDTPETREYRSRYYAAVENMDRDLGLVLDAVGRVLGRDVFILHTSDHGSQWPVSKWNCYESGVRTPMIATWPGRIAAGTRTNAMVSWIDILPTLVELAGGEAPADIDGRSFAAVLKGNSDEHRDKIFTTHVEDAGQNYGDQNVYPIRAVRSGDWKYIRNMYPDFAYTSHVDRRSGDQYFNSWREKAKTDSHAARVVYHYHWRPGEELYLLSEDPEEEHNLAQLPEYGEKLTSLRAELDRWMHEQGDTVRFHGTLSKEP